LISLKRYSFGSQTDDLPLKRLYGILGLLKVCLLKFTAYIRPLTQLKAVPNQKRTQKTVKKVTKANQNQVDKILENRNEAKFVK